MEMVSHNFRCGAAVAALALASAAYTSNFRPPAVPLFVSTPFVSIWQFDASDLASQTTFWLGTSNTLNSIVRVDGKTYQLMGQPLAGTGTAKQMGLPVVTATSSYFSFQAGGVQVDMRFTTPQLPEQFEVMARQASYLTWTATSTDGAAHSVQVYYDQTAEVVTNAPSQMIEWDRPAVSSGIVALRMGQVGQTDPSWNITQRIMNSTEPHQQQDYGYVYAMTEDGSTVTSVIQSCSNAQAAFAQSGALPGPSGDAAPPAPVCGSSTGGNMVSALAWDLGSVAAGANATCRLTFFVDEVVEILYYGAPLAPWWRRNYTVSDFAVIPADPLTAAVQQADAVLTAAAALDAQLAESLLAAGGANYSAVTQLTYRQVFGANGYAVNQSGALWGFQKEISSDGDMSTLDVIFPSAPQQLYFNAAELQRILIEPHLVIMSGHSPAHFNQPCALHSLGKWPVVDPGNGGCSMPMESTGDILLMAAMVTALKNDSAWVQPYVPMFRQFANFCMEPGSLPWPAPQDMTDDFSHAPGNLTNLALKCILGVGATAYMEAASGNTTGAKALFTQAQYWGNFFVQHAWVPGSPSQPAHFQFIYNTTWSDSYGLMYNAVWARFLGQEFIVPGFYDLFSQHYAYLSTVTANATWCIPLSSMEHDSKWDWLTNTAALMYTGNSSTRSPAPQPTAYSNYVFDQLFFFANFTSSRSPITDHPECTGAYPPAAAADRARPVLGAFFGPLLISNPPPALSAARDFVAAFAAQHLDLHDVATE